MQNTPADNSNEVEWNFFQLRTDRKFTKLEQKLAQIAWIGDELFLPGIIADPNELIVMLCASFDGVPVIRALDTFFVPAAWLEKNYPHMKEVISLIRKRSEEVRHVKL